MRISYLYLQVAQSFLSALQNDERANYQLDVKFQESYLNKVVSLLQCQLSEGAVSECSSRTAGIDNCKTLESSASDEIEEGELPGSHGEYMANPVCWRGYAYSCCWLELNF